MRDAVFDVLRRLELTTIFANPDSTEVALLTDLLDDVTFVLALHENSVVAMAAGRALAARRPSLVFLRTTAGFGNAVGAIATARPNKAPWSCSWASRTAATSPPSRFSPATSRGLAGDCPVSIRTPDNAQAAPGAVLRAHHDALLHRGPAVVVVPTGDWFKPAEGEALPAAPLELRRSAAADPAVGR